MMKAVSARHKLFLAKYHITGHAQLDANTLLTFTLRQATRRQEGG